MESTENNQPSLSFTPELIEQIGRYKNITEDSFMAFSNTIDKIFYDYVAKVSDVPDEYNLSTEDVLYLMYTKEILKLLQTATLQNQNITE